MKNKIELIDKSAVIAEIERLNEFWHLSKGADGQAFIETLLSFLDTLEVKEVDLEKEIDEELDRNWYGEYIRHDKFAGSAKHFYELGLKAKKEK